MKVDVHQPGSRWRVCLPFPVGLVRPLRPSSNRSIHRFNTHSELLAGLVVAPATKAVPHLSRHRTNLPRMAAQLGLLHVSERHHELVCGQDHSDALGLNAQKTLPNQLCSDDKAQAHRDRARVAPTACGLTC